MNSFVVTLISNSPSIKHSHSNQVLHFNSDLSRPRELVGDWEVAIIELFYPKLTKVDELFFFIYSDLIDYTYVGSEQYKILRPVLLKNSSDRYCINTDRFDVPQYYPVVKKEIRSIEVQLEPDLELEPDSYSLQTGDICMTLHFRKISNKQ